MCSDYEHASLLDLLLLAKQAPSGSVERRRLARCILRSIPLRAELFQLAMSEHMEQRLKVRNDVVWLMQGSSNIWKGYSDHPNQVDIYEEALARTWEWFGKNFCKYQPERASFVGWFNMKLKFISIEVYHEFKDDRSNRESSSVDKETGDELHPLDRLADPDQDPEALVLLSQVLVHIHAWLEEKKRLLCRLCIARYPSANCYVILSMRLPTVDVKTNTLTLGKNLSDIALSLGIPKSDISRCFYKKCLPELVTFLKGIDFL